MEWEFLEAALRCRFLVGDDRNLDGCGWKAISIGGDDYVAVGCGGTDDSEGMAFVELAFSCLEWIVVEEIAVVDRDDFAGACCVEVDDCGAVGDDSVVGIDKGCGGVGYIVPVWRESMPQGLKPLF